MADIARQHYVLGKGGVGKSTIAAALARALARRGQRVLAIEFGGPAGLARALGAELASSGAISLGDEGVSVTFIDGSAALGEYLTRKVRLGAVTQRLLEHPLYQAFARSAPGLRELMAIGKVRDELILQRRWDAVVVDAGASGHALEALRMPAAAAAAFRHGKVHREASKNARLLADPERTRVHVVATAEEMPALEAIASLKRLRDELALPVGQLFVNLTRPVPPAGASQLLTQLAQLPAQHGERSRSQLHSVGEAALKWSTIQEHYIQLLQTETRLRAVRLPRQVAASSPDCARALASQLGEVVA